MEYLLHLLALFLIYAILAVALDVVLGLAGLLSVTHAAFFGVGAYATALLSVNCGLPFGAGVLVGMALSSILAALTCLAALRLRDDYFVIATFGFQMIIHSVMNNWTALTRGPLGVRAIPPAEIFGWRVESQASFTLLAGSVAALAYVAGHRVSCSPFGRVLRAIREDEVFSTAVGKNCPGFKIRAFAFSGAIAASAGSLYAHYVTYIDPSSFTVMESILLISMVIIGGADSRWGPIVGAAVLTALPEVLRFVGLPGAVAANMRQIIYGALLVAMMVLRPRGLVGRYSFGR